MKKKNEIRKDVAIVLIHHSPNLNGYEKKSVERCFSVFKNRDIYVILKDGIDNSEYVKIASDCDKKVTFIYEEAKWLESIKSYNDYLKQPFFYERFKIYQYIQIYQTDCYAIYDNLDYFIEKGYSYYAPCYYWDCEDKNWIGKPLCGGFSLRKVDDFIKNTKKRVDTIDNGKWEAEDVYFAKNKDGIKSICTPEDGNLYCWDTYVFQNSYIEKFNNKEDLENIPMGLHLYGRLYNNDLFNYLINYYESHKYESEPKKYALAVLTNDDYIDFTYVMLASFFKHNTWFKGDVVIICDNGVCQLNDANFDLLRSIKREINMYRRVVDYNSYVTIMGRYVNVTVNKSYLRCFYKFECFRLKEYDRVVFCDSDMIYLGSIKELFYTDKDLILMEDNFNSTNNDFRKLNGERISTGGFSVSSKFIKDTVFSGLYFASLSMPITTYSIYNGGFPEQQVFEFYFKNFKNVYLMPRKFNCVNAMANGQILNSLKELNVVSDNDLRAVHLFAKPKARADYYDTHKIFYSYIDECINKLKEENK